MEELMISPSLIRENLEVLGSDGEHVGIVDHLESNGEVRLAKDDTGGEHHYIPLGWVVHVEMKVHLNQSGAEARARWKTH
jgi:hypothetical protein